MNARTMSLAAPILVAPSGGAAMRRLLVGMLALPGLLCAQEKPGRNLAVVVDVSSVSVDNGATTLGYVLRNEPTSVEQLFQFIVEAPSQVVSIGAPDPADDWKLDTTFRGRPVAMWTVLGGQLAPGHATAGLTFSAPGRPAVVDASYRGWVPPPPSPDDIAIDSEFDPLADAGVPVRVLGVETVPNNDPHRLVDRLAGMVSEVCGLLGWITAAARCGVLRAAINAARDASATSRPRDVQFHLGVVMREVSTGFDSGDTNRSARWLIRANAEFILTLLPNPPT